VVWRPRHRNHQEQTQRTLPRHRGYLFNR